MVRTAVIILISIPTVFRLFSAVDRAEAPRHSAETENHAPVVKIASPANNAFFSPGATVHYSITVSDKEDGDSKYEEINPKEVLLEIRYVDDASKLSAEINKAVQSDPPGLALIRTSNCFSCHDFNRKVIGPSFNDIDKKYNPTTANIALLGKHIREGSSGIWGDVRMPTHPELDKGEIEEIVQWIMHDASAPGVDYHIGADGMLTLPQQKGVYLLTGSYLDHGTFPDSSNRLKGQDVVVIRIK